MRLGGLLVLNAVVALVFGVAFLLVPASVASIYGIAATPATDLVARFFGVELVAVGLLSWLARNVTDTTSQRAIILAFLIADAIGLVVSLMGTLSGVMNVVGWSAVLIYLILAAGYAYFAFAKPSGP